MIKVFLFLLPVAGQLLDVYTTNRALSTGRQELNPVARKLIILGILSPLKLLFGGMLGFLSCAVFIQYGLTAGVVFCAIATLAGAGFGIWNILGSR